MQDVKTSFCLFDLSVEFAAAVQQENTRRAVVPEADEGTMFGGYIQRGLSRLPTTENNLLFILETGASPNKAHSGQYGELLKFEVQEDPVWAAELTDGIMRWRVYDGANISFQAVTRGGRFVDHILTRKAAFKKASKVSANVLFTLGLISLEDSGLSQVMNNRKPADVAAGGFFLIDPLGNLVMYFPPELNPRDMVDDLKHLLELSRIG